MLSFRKASVEDSRLKVEETARLSERSEYQADDGILGWGNGKATKAPHFAVTPNFSVSQLQIDFEEEKGNIFCRTVLHFVFTSPAQIRFLTPNPPGPGLMQISTPNQ